METWLCDSTREPSATKCFFIAEVMARSTRSRPRMSGVGPTFFLLPSSTPLLRRCPSPLLLHHASSSSPPRALPALLISRGPPCPPDVYLPDPVDNMVLNFAEIISIHLPECEISLILLKSLLILFLTCSLSLLSVPAPPHAQIQRKKALKCWNIFTKICWSYFLKNKCWIQFF